MGVRWTKKRRKNEKKKTKYKPWRGEQENLEPRAARQQKTKNARTCKEQQSMTNKHAKKNLGPIIVVAVFFRTLRGWVAWKTGRLGSWSAVAGRYFFCIFSALSGGIAAKSDSDICLYIYWSYSAISLHCMIHAYFFCVYMALDHFLSRPYYTLV